MQNLHHRLVPIFCRVLLNLRVFLMNKRHHIQFFFFDIFKIQNRVFCFLDYVPQVVVYKTFSKVSAESVCSNCSFLTNVRLESVCSSQPIQISRIYSIWHPCPNASWLHTIAEDDRSRKAAKTHEGRII